MKRTHKGFTLVELLIVVAIVGVLATMMTMSSSEAVDTAGANTIIGNLNSMKTAALQLYMAYPAAAQSDIQFGTATAISGTSETVLGLLEKYLGKKSNILVGTTGVKYGLVGKTNSVTKDEVTTTTTTWFVVYKVDTKDSVGVKNKLSSSASKYELYGGADAKFATLNAEADYSNHAYAALRVF